MLSYGVNPFTFNAWRPVVIFLQLVSIVMAVRWCFYIYPFAQFGLFGVVIFSVHLLKRRSFFLGCLSFFFEELSFNMDVPLRIFLLFVLSLILCTRLGASSSYMWMQAFMTQANCFFLASGGEGSSMSSDFAPASLLHPDIKLGKIPTSTPRIPSDGSPHYTLGLFALLLLRLLPFISASLHRSP